MIRIKDYIFNENEIREIKQCKNYLSLDLTYSGPYLHIDDATFDDIEWNYGVTQNVTQTATQNKIDDEYIELSNKYQRLLNINEEFEEENKNLKEKLDNINVSKNEAIEYIENEDEKLRLKLYYGKWAHNKLDEDDATYLCEEIIKIRDYLLETLKRNENIK